MILGENQQFASPEEALEHFGTKGMRWGVRKERARNLDAGLVKESITQTTRNGDEFTLHPSPPNKLQRAMAFASSNYAEKHGKSAYLEIKDKQGKKIGAANFWHKEDEPGTVYLNWITVNKSARGRGYASAILKAAEEHSRAAGMKKMVLEVPGDAPDARHIYEKMGFKVTKEAHPSESDPKSKNYDPMWGGLTHMEKRLDD